MQQTKRKKQKIIHRLDEIITIQPEKSPKQKGEQVNWKLEEVSIASLPNVSCRRWIPSNNVTTTKGAKNQSNVSILRYNDEEYRQLCSSRDWMRNETDILLKLCEEFDLRWVVIADRYNGQLRELNEQKERKENEREKEGGDDDGDDTNEDNDDDSDDDDNSDDTINTKCNMNEPVWNRSKSLEDLKERFYSIQNALYKHRKLSSQGQQVTIKKEEDNNVEHDSNGNLTSTSTSTLSQSNSDQSAVFFEYNRERDQRRRQELEKILMRSYEEEMELCDAIEHQRRTELKLKREIEQTKKRHDELLAQKQWIEMRANDPKVKAESNIGYGGIFGQNIGYGVIVQDNTKPSVECNGGPLHDLPKGVIPTGPHYVKKYLTATHLDVMDKRVYTVEIENEKCNVKFPYKEPKSSNNSSFSHSSTRETSPSPDTVENDDISMKDRDKERSAVEEEKDEKLAIPERIAKHVQEHLLKWDIVRKGELTLNGPATCVTHAMFHTLRGDLIKFYALQEALKKQEELIKQKLPPSVYKQLLK
ncbi:hypothetical protein RFI_06308 [Reticulomyxa filosa]|uniref:dAMP1 SANT/Myb-like domain-containing protein n=1 Tax=Reticulomyxa filosa TaxID=46433 RepID=X6NYA4_RETFI|nr:hypothetical protein RFI_06308 [Reticulomyxa filosa]|eukprot:ETO30814.1 hypothetical protein RFI_06308 [Reticulomyxa filosa]